MLEELFKVASAFKEHDSRQEKLLRIFWLVWTYCTRLKMTPAYFYMHLRIHSFKETGCTPSESFLFWEVSSVGICTVP